MLALCREHRLEHRTKHIALRYFLARELQQSGQLRLAYVASQANTADIFTKALPPGDHQRFCSMLACFALLDWSCDLLFSPTLPMGTQSLPRFTAPTTLLADIFKYNIGAMAPANNTANHEGNKATDTPVAANANILSGTTAHRPKRAAEESREDLATGVEVLLGGGSPAPSEEPSAPRAASRQPHEVAKKTTADAAVLTTTSRPSGARVKQHARAPSSHTPATTETNPSFNPAQLQALLALLQQHAPALLVADEAGFEAADRFQLYQSKSVLNSRSYKLAVADVAASKRTRMTYNRPTRGGGLNAGELGNKGSEQGSCQERTFQGTCFRCGQPSHMANACPMGGRGGQGPTPVV
ncbi:unnamed protein product [Closterium sp. NIES-53]